jgi:outer membrane protein OmpA-like peptidoglycan-associated protein
MFCGTVRAQNDIARKDYLTVDIGDTYSWLSGQNNFFWPYVYPYDARTPSPSQAMPFAKLGSGLGFTVGLGVDFPVFGEDAIRLGIFYRTNTTGITEPSSRQAGNIIAGSGIVNLESTYKSVWTYVGGDLLFRFKMFTSNFYGLGGFSFVRLLNDRFDATQKITNDTGSYQYVDLPANIPNGKREFTVNDQTSNNLYGLNNFSAKLGLGYLLPLTQTVVFSPEVIFNIPFSKISSGDAADFYSANGATPPSMYSVELHLGIKFVIGEPREAAAQETTAPPMQAVPIERPVEKSDKPFAMLSGKVRDASSNMPLIADLTVLDLDTKDTVESGQTTITGDFTIKVKKAGRYSVTASNRDHLFGSILFIVSETGISSSTGRDIRLLKEEGTQRLLVFYDVDKYELKPESYPELDRVVRFLKENPQVTVQIAGHTDSIGTDDYNQKLSERRAQAVVDYLVARNIFSARIQAIGYGKTKPVSANDTEDGRAKNRRVEMVVKKN